MYSNTSDSEVFDPEENDRVYNLDDMVIPSSSKPSRQPLHKQPENVSKRNYFEIEDEGGLGDDEQSSVDNTPNSFCHDFALDNHNLKGCREKKTQEMELKVLEEITLHGEEMVNFLVSSESDIIRRFTSRFITLRNDSPFEDVATKSETPIRKQVPSTDDLTKIVVNETESEVTIEETISTQNLKAVEQTQPTPKPITKKKPLTRLSDEEEIQYGFKSSKALKRSIIAEVIFWLACILSMGTLLIVCKWVPWLKCFLTHYWTENFEDADCIMLEARSSIHGMDGSNGKWTVCSLHRANFHVNSSGSTATVLYFRYRFLIYVYDSKQNYFVPATFRFCNKESSVESIHSLARFYLSSHTDLECERIIRTSMFGKNTIETPVKPLLFLLIDEVFHPFYIFQIFSVIIWCWIQYYIYAVAIAIISTISGIISLWSTRTNMVKLREMTSSSCEVTQLKANNQGDICKHRVNSSQLAPGDIIEIENDMDVPCDVILLSGHVVMNESLMTGESTPVKKIPLPFAFQSFSSKEDKPHTLFAGTRVIMVKPKMFHSSDVPPIGKFYQRHFSDKVVGMVLNTGFQTTKGKLLLPIIFAKPNNFQLYRDSFKFLGIMAFFGVIGVIGTVYNLYKIHVPIVRIILENIVLMTIVVPPALPIAITTTISFAVSRLKTSWKIYCIAPQRVSLSGLVKLIVFDKTNTLTSDNLDMHGCVLIDESNTTTTFGHLTHEFSSDSMMAWGMATCHDLSHIVSHGRSKIVGDPLDMKVFESIKWRMDDEDNFILVSSSDGKHSFSIMKVFQFKSSLQRMSVIVRHQQTGDVYCFLKGSAEMIKQLSQAIPNDFSKTLYKYSHKGYRVIAMAYRKLGVDEVRNVEVMDREFFEKNMNFCGLIILENKLKSETSGVIKKLINANIKNVIASGDNAYTVIAVARKCNILPNGISVYLAEFAEIGNDESWWNHIIWRNVDREDDIITTEQIMRGEISPGTELAVTGDVFNYIHLKHMYDVKQQGEGSEKPYVDVSNPSLLHRLLNYCRIYARFSPSDKMKVVEEFQKIDYLVMMCGDGQNDIKALKAAHVGVSLSSEAEASLAAPFTSLRPTIGCVPAIIREGRSALWSSFQVFKYMSLYCLIQFYSVVILFQKNTKMADFQYLYVDMFVILPTILLMTRTKASTSLKRVKPPSSLINRVVLLSWFGQLLLSFVFVMFVWIELHSGLPWAKLLDDPSADVTKNYYSYETTLIFLISTYCTINCGISFSIGTNFKRSLLSDNVPFVLFTIGIYLFTIYFTLVPCSWLKTTLQFMNIPMYYRVRIIIYGLLHLVVSYGFELVLVSNIFRRAIKSISLVHLVQHCIHWSMKSSSTLLIDTFMRFLNYRKSKQRKYKQLSQRLGIKKHKQLRLMVLQEESSPNDLDIPRAESQVHLLEV